MVGQFDRQTFLQPMGGKEGSRGDGSAERSTKTVVNLQGHRGGKLHASECVIASRKNETKRSGRKKRDISGQGQQQFAEERRRRKRGGKKKSVSYMKEEGGRGTEKNMEIRLHA